MAEDYFYGAEAEQFSFYQIPRILMTDDRYKDMSDSAKILFGLMLSRMALSRKNGWFDECGRVYIIYAVEDAMTDMNCGNKKVVKLMKKLETFHLIIRKRQGQGKPSLIYPLNFTKTGNAVNQARCVTVNKKQTLRILQISRSVKRASLEVSKGHAKYIDNSYIDCSYSSLPIASLQEENRSETKRSESKDGNKSSARNICRELIKVNISYDALLHDYPDDADRLKEILEIIVDTICTL